MGRTFVISEYTITYSITDSTTSGTAPVRVQFLSGSTSATMPGVISQSSGNQAYLLAAVTGQVMTIQLLAATTPLFITISGPNSALLAQQPGSYRQDWTNLALWIRAAHRTVCIFVVDRHA